MQNNKNKYQLNQKIILQSNIAQIDFNEQVKKIFLKSTKLDKGLQELLHTSDAAGVEMKQNKLTLQFLDTNSEKMFNHTLSVFSRYTFRLVLFITFVIYLIYLCLEKFVWSQDENPEAKYVDFYIRITIFVVFIIFLGFTYSKEFMNRYI